MTTACAIFRHCGVAALIAIGAAAPVAAADDAPDGVSFERSAAGRTFVTADGRAYYWNRAELASQAVVCMGGCLADRLPFVMTADAPLPPGWTAIDRPDGGGRQWAYQGKLLYTATADSFPGARLGGGGPWALMFEPTPLPASFTLQNALVGRVLADHKGRTLYTGVTGGDSWLPITAPWLASAAGDWSLEPMADGARQWAYRGGRLFRHADDDDPQDLRGQGVDGARAVVLEPPPGMPAWMTIQRVDLAWVFADRNGLTLYAPDTLEQIEIAQTCMAECMATYWRPVLAGPDETPVGRWTIVETKTGQRQWAFNGRLLFTHTRDTKPGEMTGNSYAVGYSIGDGFRVIPIDANLPPAF